jgi:hypothetical protein
MPEDMLDRLFSDLAAAELPVPAASRVVARGRQRRYRARGRAASAVLAAAAIVGAGVSQLPGSRPSTRPAEHHHTSSASAVCPAAPEAALTTERTRALPLSRQAGVWPIGVSPDGAAVYVQTTTHGFHGIAEESLANGAILTKIERLPASYSAQGGLGPPGDVVWHNTYGTHGGQGSAGTTPMYLWSSATGRTAALEPAGQHGDALSAPVFFPGHKLAAWLQADGGTQEIVEANLGTEAVAVIAHGYLGPPVFVGNALVWPAASRPDGPAAHLVAMNGGQFPARHPIAVPLPLREAGQASLMGSGPAGSWPVPVPLIASDGSATAFISQNLTELFYSPSPSQPARLVLRLHGGNTFAAGAPAVGDGYLGWTVNADASYLASATSLAAARITTLGKEFSAGSYVFVMGSSGAKTQPTQNPFHLFSGPVVSTLRCLRPAKSASP